MAKGRRKKADVLDKGYHWEYVASLMNILSEEYGVRLGIQYTTHKYSLTPYMHISSVPREYDETHNFYAFCTVAVSVKMDQAIYPKDVADLLWRWREEIETRPSCWGVLSPRYEKQRAYENGDKAVFDRPPWETGN